MITTENFSPKMREKTRGGGLTSGSFYSSSVGEWLKKPTGLFPHSQIVEQGEANCIWRRTYPIESGELA